MLERQIALDLQEIRTLAREMASPEIALRFLKDFLGMLPGRHKRILAALGEEDADAAMDAIISLKITSSMTGLLETEAYCVNLQSLVEDGNFGRARTEAKALSGSIRHIYNAAPALLRKARTDLGLHEEPSQGCTGAVAV